MLLNDSMPPISLKDQCTMRTYPERAPLGLLTQTIFHEPWWLEIACDGSYCESVVSSGGIVVGRLPYRKSRLYGSIIVLDMPLLAHVLGPVVAPQFAGDNFPRSLKEFAIVQELIAQLPRASHISFRLHGDTTNTLAFEAAGFTTSSSFTVEVAAASSDALWRQMRDKTRNVIRRASECLAVSEMYDADRFLKFYQDNLSSKGLKNEYSDRITSQLIKECLRRNTGRILIAVDAAGNIQAAIFTVWDRVREYYFMASRRLDAVNGATPLLIWNALQHASSNALIFDMDGIHVVGRNVPNLLLLTGFGGSIVPRFQVQRSSPAIDMTNQLRGRWKRIQTLIKRSDRR